MIQLLQATATPILTPPDSTTTSLTEKAVALNKGIASGEVDWNYVIRQLIDWMIDAGRHILVAFIVYLVGHYLIKLLNYLLARLLERRKVEVSVQTFVKSFTGITFQILLLIMVIEALGLNTTSLAALLASFGVAIGMALSGNLQNFAGGIVILFLKPYKVGDWVEAQGTAGTVQSIQIFHTILLTADGKRIYVPNGAMSSGSITNYTQTSARRVDLAISIEYGSDVERARATILQLLDADERINKTPAPEVWLQELNSSSVDLTVRCWTSNSDYWSVLFETREKIYNTFNAQGITFPFPQITVHHV